MNPTIERERPPLLRRDPLVAAVLRAVADLHEPHRSALQLRYGLLDWALDYEMTAERLGISLSELEDLETTALESVGFHLLREAGVLRFLERLR